MALYEHVFLARQDISTQQVEALIEQFKTIISENGGTVGKVEPWGLKTITYRIRKNRKAHYTLLNIDAPAAAVTEMERQMRINEDILRFLTVKVEAHENEPSAMMQKRDRERDRDDRRGGFGFGDRGGFGGGRRDRNDRPPRRDAPMDGGDGEVMEGVE